VAQWKNQNTHNMKQISILIFGIMICTNIMANDCELITFNSNYSSNYNSTDVFFIKGVNLKTIYHGIQIKILEDFKQNLQEDTIMVWCSDGNSFRVESSASYNVNDTLYLLIKKTDLEGNDPGDLNEIPDDLEKPDDYMPIHCAYTILKYSKGLITGKISSIQQDTTISVLEFFNQLSTGFNLPNSERNIKIFPNPVSSELFITINNNVGLPLTTEIYNNNGQLIQSSRNGAIEYVVNTCSLSKGTYFIKIIDNSNKCLISKFIKL
jgi:hypothetical protein